MTQANEANERRVHERLGVVVPVELRVFDHHGGACVMGPLHALVTDASASGLRVELAGPSAAVFDNNKYDNAPVTVSFLLVSLVGMGQVACDVRWTSTTAEGRALGLQLTGEKLMQSRVLRLLEATSMPRMARRTALRAGAVAALVLLVAALAAFAWDGVRVQKDLRDQVDLMTVQMRDLQNHAGEVQHKLEMAVRDNNRLLHVLDALRSESSDQTTPTLPAENAQAEDEASE